MYYCFPIRWDLFAFFDLTLAVNHWSLFRFISSLLFFIIIVSYGDDHSEYSFSEHFTVPHTQCVQGKYEDWIVFRRNCFWASNWSDSIHVFCPSWDFGHVNINTITLERDIRSGPTFVTRNSRSICGNENFLLLRSADIVNFCGIRGNVIDKNLQN